jgi:hypothetical protein
MLAEFTREELAAGLDRVVEEVLAESGTESPPVDAFAIAQALGLTVAWDASQDGRGKYVRLGGSRSSEPRGTILLRPDARGERQQWAAAHEIGEHVAHRVFVVWKIDPRETAPNAREVVANALAGRILLPTFWFVPDCRRVDWDLLALKMRYPSASHELIARRMLECEPPVVITIFDGGKITFRRSNVHGRPPSPSSAEMACWQAVHRQSKPSERESGSCCRVSGWPVHEPGWKREVLRTEFEDDGWYR